MLRQAEVKTTKHATTKPNTKGEQFRLNEELWENLHDLEKTRKLLNKGANANLVREGWWKGWTPLAYAVSLHNREVRGMNLSESQISALISVLLEHNANAQQQLPGTDLSLLAYLVKENKTQDAILLVKHGADAEQLSHDGQHSLLQQVLLKMKEYDRRPWWILATKLIEAGAVIPEKFPGMNFSLEFYPFSMYCILFSNFYDESDDKAVAAFLKALTKRGRNIHLQNIYLSTPLASAAENSFIHVAQTLLESGADPREAINETLSQIMRPARSPYPSLRFPAMIEDKSGNQFRIFILLLHAKNKYQSGRADDPSTLFNDLDFKTLDCEDYFIQHVLKPGSIEEESERENSYIEHIRQNNLAEFQKLKKSGVSLATIKDDEESSLLHCAAMHNTKVELLEFLTDSGCELNALNKLGETPLFCAVATNQRHVVEFLVNHGADKTINYPHGSIYRITLRLGKDVKIFRKLMESISNVDQPLPNETLPPLNLAAQYGHCDAIRYLKLERNAELNASDEKAMAPLHEAVHAKQAAAVKTLLDLGAEFSSTSEAGKTLLLQTDSEEIRGLLTTHHAKKVASIERTTHLSQAIFLALFADVMQLRKASDKKREEYLTVKNLILLTIKAFPQIDPLLAKLDLQSLKQEEKKQSPIERQFSSFLTATVIARENQNAAARKKWLEKLENTPKVQESFQTDLQEACERYASRSSSQIGLDILVKKILGGIKPLKSVTQKNLALWIETILGNTPQLKEANSAGLFFSEDRATRLANQICDEINFSLNEESNIDETHRESFYKTRIQAGVDQWLFAEKLLTGKELKSCRITHAVIEKLKEQCITDHKSEKGMKPKKVGLAFTLMKEVLLREETVWDELDESADAKATEADLIQTLFNTLKEDRIEKRKLKNKKVDRLEDFSRNRKVFKLYKGDIQHGIQNWYESLGYKSNTSLSRSRHSVFGSRAKTEELKLTAFDVNKKEFIDTFMQKFFLVFGKFQSLDAGLVRRNIEAIDKIAAETKNVQLPDLKLDGITVPCTQVKDILLGIGIYLKDRQVAKAASTFMHLFAAHNPLEAMQVIKESAELVVHRYAWQIERLQPEGARKLAECAVNRAIQYVTDPKNLSENDPGIADWIRSKFSPKSPSKKEEYVGPLRAIVTGVLYGASPDTDNAKINTSDAKKDDKPWIAKTLFENTGIIAPDHCGQDQYYLHANVPMSDTGEPYYGYCRATQDEVTVRKFEPVIRLPVMKPKN